MNELEKQIEERATDWVFEEVGGKDMEVVRSLFIFV